MAEHKPPTEVCNCGQRGWMPGVIHIPSKAVGGWLAPGAMKPIACVVHTIEGWQATMVDPSWTTNSYHATLGLSGKIIQHVSVFDSAWHAGRLDFTDPAWKLWRGRGTSVNAYTVGIAAEGSVDGGEITRAWTPAQTKAAIRFLKWLGPVAGITWNADTLTEHSQIAVTSRRDPGPQWPKSTVLAGITAKELTPEQRAVVIQIWDNIALLTQDDIEYMLGLVGLDSLPPRPDDAPPPPPAPEPTPEPAPPPEPEPSPPPEPTPPPGGSLVELFVRLEDAERELADIRRLAQGLL